MSCVKSQPGEIEKGKWADNPSLSRAPWNSAPHGVVSLYDVLTYAADVFCVLTEIIGRIIGAPIGIVMNGLQSENTRQHLLMQMAAARKLCTDHGWKETESRIADVESYLLSKPMLPIVLQHKCADLENHVLKMLGDNLFFHVQRERLTEFLKFTDDFKILMEPFHESLDELWAARRCYLFDEPVAAIFHSMRALEIGLTSLAASLGITPQSRDQWEVIINNIEVEIKKINGPHAGSDWKKKQESYSNAALHFRYLKNAWRNHVMHVRHTYDDQKALKILRNVTDFLISLSSELGLKEPTAPAKP